jgi:hypothetical protein
MPSWLPIVAFVCAGLALLRYLVGIPLLWRFVRNANLRRIPKGETPPIHVLVAAQGSPKENLVAILRQNYPAFDVLFLGGGAAAEAANAAVPDVRVPDKDGPFEKRFLLLTGDSRPDPLFLRDAANGLARARVVKFVPVRFGMETGRARRAALLANSDGILDRLTSVRTAGLEPAWALDSNRDKPETALARRPLRVHAPDLPLENRVPLPSTFASLLLIACALDPEWRCAALYALALLTLLRAVVAVTVDLAFARDGSTLRSLPWLPVLWILEPVMTVNSWRSAGSVRAKLRELWRTRSPTART